MLAATQAVRVPSTFREWHEAAPRSYQKSDASSADYTHTSCRSRVSDDANTSTVLTSPTGSSMSATSAPAIVPGKKRKRLQRACVACHRAKRRCDGGLPCSNCDFSGRSCSYSDAQGKAVPPTKRTLKPSEVAMQQQERQNEMLQHRHQTTRQSNSALLDDGASSYGSTTLPYGAHSYCQSLGETNFTHRLPTTRHSSSSPSHLYDQSSPRMHRYSNASSSSEISLEARRELLHIFFTSVQPWNCILDESTILRDFTAQRAPLHLLNAIFAIGAQHAFLESRRISPSSYRHGRLSALVNEVGDGSTFAEDSHRMLYQGSTITKLSAVDGDISPDTAQALCLLACFEHAAQRLECAAAYTQTAAKYIISWNNDSARNTSRMDIRVNDRDVASFETLHKRLVCIIALLDVLTCVSSGRNPSLRTWDLESAVGNFADEAEDDLLTAAFAQQLKTILIVCSALETQKRATRFAMRSNLKAPSLETASISNQARACEAYLQSWADTLPERLRFDEDSLRAARHALVYGDVEQGFWTATSALSWSAIHVCAEAAILLLQDATCTDFSLAAARNIAMILELLPPSALCGPLGTFGIAVLKSSATAAERSLNLRPGSSSDNSTMAVLKPWIVMKQTADLLARDAQLPSAMLTSASNGLAIGAAHDATATISFADQGRNGRTSALSSWMLSPSNRVRSGSATLASQRHPAEFSRFTPIQASASRLGTGSSSATNPSLDRSLPSPTPTHASLAASSRPFAAKPSSQDISSPRQLLPLPHDSNRARSVSGSRDDLASSSSSTNKLPPLRLSNPMEEQAQSPEKMAPGSVKTVAASGSHSLDE